MTYDPHEIAGVFGRAAASYDTVVPFFTEFGKRLVDFAGLRSGESVLDVGCGRGATLFPGAERVGPEGRVLGVDLAEEMVRLLRADIDRRGLEHAEARQMDAQALDVGPGSFDVVLASFVLHLLPDPGRGAASMAEALRPGGRCVASVPTGGGPEWDFMGRIFVAYAARAGLPPRMPFRPDFDLPATLTGAGLRVTRSTREVITFHFADEQAWWDWGWTHGVRGVFEMLTPGDLESMRRELFAELAALRTPAGIPMAQTAVFVVAER
ncbi:MAG TPA: methyltransferase domain-containing protein [Acidimicrobiales bacterium]|nr:methyltransferase domain-containing protein [Acidimicrobiales bacterium]